MKTYEPLALVIGVTLGIFLCIPVQHRMVRDSWREDAIKRGFAEYSSTTGEWRWKPDLTKAKEEDR